MGDDFPLAPLYLICAMLLCSCTSISFQGKGFIPLYLTPRPDHTKYIEARGHKEFYLWGLVGPDNDVFLDEILYDKGLISGANVTVQEYQKTSSFLKALFSFGFYIQKDYIISAKGIDGGDF